jgi:hypothetical protein
LLILPLLALLPILPLLALLLILPLFALLLILPLFTLPALYYLLAAICSLRLSALYTPLQLDLCPLPARN